VFRRVTPVALRAPSVTLLNIVVLESMHLNINKIGLDKPVHFTTLSMRSKKSSYVKVLLLLPKQYTMSFKQKALQNSFAEHMLKDGLLYKGLRNHQK
jgi:hypothetical protein